jgi:hypothetical protein
MTRSLIALACLIFVSQSSALVAQDAKEKAAAAAAQQKEWEAFMSPGPEHALLKNRVGKWKTVSKSFHEPGKDPEVSEGTASFKLIMGGRYLQQNFSGNYSGMKMQGQGLLGYNNGKKKYEGTWVDNFGTGILVSEGTYDAKTKTITEISLGAGPGGAPMKMKMVTKDKDKDNFTFSMFMILPDGTEIPAIEIAYTRLAKKPKKPGTKKPSAKTPSTKKPSDKKPGAKKTVSKKPGEKKPGTEKAVSKKPGTEKANPQKPGVKKTETKKPR